MSTKIITVVGGTLLALGFFGGALEGCGGGSSSVDCNKVCEKTTMCIPGADPAQCKAMCMMRSGQTGGVTCKNQSAIVSAFNKCLDMPCETFLGCALALPPCDTGGAGGSGGSGSGGSASGSGGSGGSGADGSTGAGCEVCTKADACCNAFTAGFDAGMCGLEEECNAATGTQRTQAVALCTMFLGNFSMNPSAPAACK